MKGKLAFILGAGVGYFLGTKAGREQYEKIKASARSALEHPAVKEKVTQAENAITEVVRQQGAKVTDQVASMVKERFAAGASTTPTAAAPAPTTYSSNGPTSAWDTPQR